MTSVPCPQHDGGLCNVPDPAVLISDGEFSLIRARAAQRLFPNIESRALRRLDLPGSIHYSDLVLSVAKSLTPEVALAGSAQDDDDYQNQARAHILDSVAAAAGPLNGIIVNCSCGHIFTV